MLHSPIEIIESKTCAMVEGVWLQVPNSCLWRQQVGPFREPILDPKNVMPQGENTRAMLFFKKMGENVALGRFTNC